MKIVQINSFVNSGSTGRIAEHVGMQAIARGHDSLIVYGRRSQESASRTYKVGNFLALISHGAESLLFDRHGLGSRNATKRLVQMLHAEKPDVIGLHNLHGYFLNFEILFDYFHDESVPVVWTLHDCWPFTGHCSHFERYDCQKWQSQCSQCPMTGRYPKSMLDFSNRNFRLKRRHFCGLKSMTIVTPSEWLKGVVNRSFLSEYPIRVINNGVNLDAFRPAERNDYDEVLILGVANVWSDSKGLRDFIELRKMLPESYHIKLVGVTGAQRCLLPKGVEGVFRTESVADLVSLYQDATVFVNPTHIDNFPTTNLEALACGVPIVTYDTGGSPEALDQFTGVVVPKGDVCELANAIIQLVEKNRAPIIRHCRSRAERLFNQADRFSEYIDLFETVHELQI